ncbi:fatty acyl-CoA reductase wat-like [Diaphorina citri]|uniref:Fatty acyl-CoA reductase n=2 Tax=Diaphorina citri TaxID=121845 RepID=A0A3Q0JDR7_DIACI|nr:fatty acyl-CoA reductase wat-like [Diaphorina citri]
MVYPWTDIVNSKYFTDPLELLGEKSFGSPDDIPDDEIGTPMQEFYRDKTIFLTGGTGFMGKTVVEKLLRSCPHLKHIYLLVRPKKGKDIQERLDAIFEDRLFWRLRAEVPDFRSKVSAVAGDCSLPGLGLSETDRATLVKQVNIVFHGAATVRFDEHIKMAVKINVCGVQAMLQLAREMKDLKAFVHVSTAFTHCPRERIDEEFYPVPLKYENLIQLISETGDEELSEMTPKLLHEWPNTYTFTKALAEPIFYLLCSTVVSTYREPVRGWIDNVYGPIGMLVGIATGVLHTHLINLNTVTDMVPVDLVVNSMISIAWSIGESGKVEKAINKIENNTLV